MMQSILSSFPGGSDGKESACNAGDLGSISGLVRSPGGGQGSPVQYSCLENPHGQRSLADYSPWGGKESDMTERLSTAQHITNCIYTDMYICVYKHIHTYVCSECVCVCMCIYIERESERKTKRE